MRAIDIKISVIILAILCTAAAAKTIYVDDNAIGANNGSNWDNAYIYLQEALADAKDSEKPVEIRVAQGTYKPDGGIVAIPEFDWRTLTFQLISGVSLKGGYPGAGTPDPNTRDIELYETILTGDLNGDDIDINDLEDLRIAWIAEPWLPEPNREDNTYHVVTGSSTDDTAVLDGFTITGGNADCFPLDDGGGMFIDAGWPTVKNCTFFRNTAYDFGGGITCENQSDPTLIDCIFEMNYAFYGGGMSSHESNSMLNNCKFNDNFTAGFALDGFHRGGGIFNSHSSPTLINCTFSKNSTGQGSGMYNHASTPVLTNCIFSRNTGGYGVGIYNMESTSSLTNCIFSRNTGDSGIGMYNSESNSSLTNCIFSGNSAEDRHYASAQGGAMYNSESNTILTNCIISGNFTDYGSAISCYDSSIQIINSTITDNIVTQFLSGAIHFFSSNLTIVNSIFWNDVPNEIYYSQKRGSVSVSYSNLESDFIGEGNINEDPLFVSTGYWADANDPEIIVEPNDPNAVWVEGDYHLKSQAGRWDPNSGSWIVDDVTSPCIDAGDPNSDWSGELWPHGERINMGAYGGTAEASMSVEAEGMSLPRVLYVYDDDMAATDSFKSLLEMYGVSVTSVSVNNLEQVSMNDYDLVILGDDTAWAQALEDGQFVAAVEDSNKPVVGLGHGGYDFFGELELSIGKPHGAHTSNNSITVLDPNSLLFSTPYPIDIPEDGILQLYTETDSVSIYLWPEVPETVTVLAGEANNTGYYPLVMEHNRYLLWGFTESPEKMTEVGKILFVNVVIRAANSAW